MSFILMCLAGEMIGKALTQPYVKLAIKEKLVQTDAKHSTSPSSEAEGVSYGDSYMMAAMYQSMGNDL